MAQLGDVREHLAQAHVLPAQDMSLADAAAAQSRQMPGRHIVDVDEIEAGLHKSRHAAARRLDDDAPGWSGVDVTRADPRRGIDDDGGKLLLIDHVYDQTFDNGLAHPGGTARAV